MARKGKEVSDLREEIAPFREELKGLKTQKTRLDRHRRDLEASRVEARWSKGKIEELEEEVATLKVQVASVSENLCHCGGGSPEGSSKGVPGSSEGSYHLPLPATPSVVPENEEPIPVLLPNALLAAMERDLPADRDVLQDVTGPLLEEEGTGRTQMEREYAYRMGLSNVRAKPRKVPFPKRRRVNAARMSTGTRRKHPYFLPVESKVRRGSRRAQRGIESGCQSDSESGSEGLSFDSDAPDLVVPSRELPNAGRALSTIPESPASWRGSWPSDGELGGSVGVLSGVHHSSQA